MWEQLKRRSSYQALPTYEPKKDIYRDLHHPIFQNIRVVQVIINSNNFSDIFIDFFINVYRWMRNVIVIVLFKHKLL